MNRLGDFTGAARNGNRTGAHDDIDLFVFGEAALTGLNVVDAGSIDVVDRSEILRKVNRLTKDFSTAICIGFVESEASEFCLAHCLSSDGALCGIQRKVFAGNPPRPHVFASGKEIRPIPFRGSQVAILACADRTLPETVLAAGQHEPDLILAPTDQYSWTPHNQSVLHRADQSASFWLQAPLFAAFISVAEPLDTDADVFACLAFDNQGDELIRTSKKAGEITVHTVDVEFQIAHRKWGGFQERKRYLDYVWNSPK